MAFAVLLPAMLGGSPNAAAAVDDETPGESPTEPRDGPPALTWWNSGVFVVPYLGAYATFGKDTGNFGMSGRVGGFVGGWLERAIVLAGELTWDILRAKEVPPRAEEGGGFIDLAFSPFWHRPLGPRS